MKRRAKRTFLGCGRMRSDKRTVVIGTVLVFISGLISRLLSGSPLRMLHITGARAIVPPVWLFMLVWLAWYLLLGFCFGFILGSEPVGKSVHKYKGCFWFIVMMIFNVLWYPLFFKAGMIFLALIDLAFILVFCVLTFLEYRRIHKTVGLILFLHMIWLIFCLCINIRIFIHI